MFATMLVILCECRKKDIVHSNQNNRFCFQQHEWKKSHSVGSVDILLSKRKKEFVNTLTAVRHVLLMSTRFQTWVC